VFSNVETQQNNLLWEYIVVFGNFETYRETAGRARWIAYQ